MTRRIIKNGEKLDTNVRNCIGNTMPVDPDDVDDADTETRKIIKTKPDKKAPGPKKKDSATGKKKNEVSVEGGNVRDADTEASEEKENFSRISGF